MPKTKTSDGELISGMSAGELIDYLNKKYGANSLILASNAVGIEIQHVATGSYALDFALGGGFPQNRIIEIRGPFSSFKSTISLCSLRNFQKKYPDGFGIYIDVEKTFDGIYAQKLGVDLDRLILVNPDSGEQAVNIAKDVMKWQVHIWIILDSVAALVPLAEMESDTEQQFMGLHARLVGRLMRIATARLKRSLYDPDLPSTTILALNQLRMKIGVMFGNPETTPGGMAKDFFYSTIIRLNASAAKANVILKEETKNKITKSVRYGQTVDFKVIKNKCGGPQNEEGQFQFFERPYELYRPLTFNNLHALFEYGAFLEVIDYDDSEGYSFASISAKRPSRFLEILEKKPKTQRMLYLAILNKQRSGRNGT